MKLPLLSDEEIEMGYLKKDVALAQRDLDKESLEGQGIEVE